MNSPAATLNHFWPVGQDFAQWVTGNSRA